MIPDFSRVPPCLSRRTLIVLPVVLFLVAFVFPDLGPFWAQRDIDRGTPEGALRYIREGRRSSAYVDIVPFVQDPNRHTRELAVRELSRMGDPRAIPFLFEAYRQGMLEHRLLVEAISRQSNLIVIPVLERELRDLSKETNQEVEAVIGELREERNRWTPPAHMDAIVNVHVDLLTGQREPMLKKGGLK
ncbi:MAG: HEAT repeat domain-containing protein [Candidatus Sumerlaeia bacterium]|nr:HEAT repeat domain-containing protein [Candidatus Sumerlaeia bacterium]